MIANYSSKKYPEEKQALKILEKQTDTIFLSRRWMRVGSKNLNSGPIELFIDKESTFL